MAKGKPIRTRARGDFFEYISEVSVICLNVCNYKAYAITEKVNERSCISEDSAGIAMILVP